jgi:group I intron endonuclease
MNEDKEFKWCVYMHTSPSGKRYIGITSQNPQKRWQNGNGYLRKKDGVKYDQPAMAYAVLKYPDWKNQWQHQILFDNLSEEDAKHIEQELIDKHQTIDSRYGYNITKGGDGHVGHSPTEETRKKISDGVKKSMTEDVIAQKRKEALGRPPMSEETKKKISESNSGEKHPFWGKRHSDETKEKMRVARIGKNVGASHPRARAVYCYELDEHFGSLTDVKNKYGFNTSNIAACCRGKLKYCGKHPITGESLHWKYIDKTD